MSVTVEHNGVGFEASVVLKYDKDAWVEKSMNKYYHRLIDEDRKTALELVYDKCVAAMKEGEKPQTTVEKPAKPVRNKPARTQKPEQKVTANPGSEEDANKE